MDLFFPPKQYQRVRFLDFLKVAIGLLILNAIEHPLQIDHLPGAKLRIQGLIKVYQILLLLLLSLPLDNHEFLCFIVRGGFYLATTNEIRCFVGAKSLELVVLEEVLEEGTAIFVFVIVPVDLLTSTTWNIGEDWILEPFLMTIVPCPSVLALSVWVVSSAGVAFR